MNYTKAFLLAIIGAIFSATAKVEHLKQVEPLDGYIRNHERIIVKIGRPACTHCQLIAPKFSANSEKYKSVFFLEVNVDEHEALADRYNVFQLPTFITFKKGAKIAQWTGPDAGKLVRELENLTK